MKMHHENENFPCETENTADVAQETVSEASADVTETPMDEVSADTVEDTIDEDELLDALGEKKGKKGKNIKKAKKEKKARSAGAKRRLRYNAGFTAVIAAAIVAIVLLNVLVGVLADRYPLNLDISANKPFTLSEHAIEIAKKVDKEINMVIFTDEETVANPSTSSEELDNILRELNNALKQYNSYSGGKVTYTFINPTQEPQKYAAYSKYEVKENDMLFVCDDRHKILSLSDLYTLDTSSYSTTGTYSITESLVDRMLASPVYALSGGEEHIVQVLVGHEEDSYVIDGLQSLYELNGYTFEELSITTSAEFNKNANIMLIAAPEKDYTAAEIKRVQEWMFNNGNYGRQLMVYVSATADCPNLYEFLKVEYQITVTDELIVETALGRNQNYTYLHTMTDVPYNDYTSKASGTATVFTPEARRLTTTLPEELEDGSIGSYAVSLTEYPETGKLSKLEDLLSDEETDEEEISYAAPLEEYPLTTAIICAIDSYNNETGKAVDGRVLVSGCAKMAYSSCIQNTSLNNEEFLLGCINAMTGVENAITISSKAIDATTVEFTDATQVIVGIGVFTVGLPIIVLLICLVVFLRRKNL